MPTTRPRQRRTGSLDRARVEDQLPGGLTRVGLAASGADALNVALDLVAVDIDHQDARALFSQAARRRAADAPGTACDNRSLTSRCISLTPRVSLPGHSQAGAQKRLGLEERTFQVGLVVGFAVVVSDRASPVLGAARADVLQTAPSS